eukprot:14367521-Alexandrium_andersonii.AAC.1
MPWAKQLWLQTLWLEARGPPLRRGWLEDLAKTPAEHLTRAEELKKVWPLMLNVVDAKSLYDHLVKDCPGMSKDRRCAIELSLNREEMKAGSSRA